MGDTVIPDPLPESVIPDPLPSQTVPTGSISQAPSGVGAWLNSAENDVRYGGTSTMLGKLLSAAGAPGVNRGVSEGVADQMGGQLLGPIKAAQGVSEMGQHPFIGALKAAAGGLQTVSPALAFMAPEAAEGAASIPGRMTGRAALERGSQAFQDVMAAAKSQPVPITDNLSQALSRYQDLVNAGGSRSLSVSKLLNRITDPGGEPLTYGEARDFYSNISKLSADEFNRLTPTMQRQVGNIRAALNEAISQGAEQVGKGQQYMGAMRDYRSGSQLQDFKNMLRDQMVKGAIRALPYGVGAGAGAYAASKIFRR